MTLLKILSLLVLLYGIAGLILSFLSFPVKNDYGQPKKDAPPRKFILPFFKAAIPIGAIAMFILSVIVRVGAQDVGILITPSGVAEDELHTGWHIVMPWNSVHMMDKTVWVYTCAHSAKEGQKPDADAIWASTKDGIKMGFDASVSWKIIPDEASWIYSNVTENDGGSDGRYMWLEENVIRPKLKSSLALTVSNYSPIEAYSTKRQQIQDEILKKMREEARPYKIVIDQVDLREIFYNADYEKSINAKKLAEQEALRLIEVTKQKEELLKQAEIEKNIAIQTAEGEAEALKIKGTSIAQNPKIIELEWINKWDGQLPTYMMGNGQGVILNLNK
jgi:regulator of protease activity HflC (stomatin/prohibitin superfamily)